jgi:2-oxo-3-hexenedioate decarboxylase
MKVSFLQQRDALASILDEARIARRAIPPPPPLASMDASDAYRIQDSLVARRQNAGDRVVGWKLGITSMAKQEAMGLTTPVFGRIFADGQIANAGTRPYAAFIAPRAEPELAFCLGRELDASWDRDALLEAIAWVAPALEITDGRYLPGKRTAVELIADNTAAASYAIGAHLSLRDLPPLDNIKATIARNGQIVSRGKTGDVLGDPVRALVLLAQHLHERGLRAPAGSIVLSGAITNAFAISPGDWVSTALSGLGEVTVMFS